MSALGLIPPAVLTAASWLVFAGCETTRTPQPPPVAAVAGTTHTREAAEREPAPVPAVQAAPVSKLDSTRQKAEAGDPNAQMVLAQRYDNGNGVEQSNAEAFKWWLKAAEQGAATAQHNVGVAYLTGVGVARDKDQALKWLSKAANQGHLKAGEYAGRLKQEKEAATPVVAKGGPRAAPLAARTTRPGRYGPKEEICAEVVANFVARHTSIPEHFVCVEFAAGVWHELMKKGVQAKVRFGSTGIASIHQADHAWVMAEVSPGNWLAIVPQRGVVYPESGSAYYRGYDFSDDGPVREYNRAIQAHWNAWIKYNEEVKDYNYFHKLYVDGDLGAQAALLPIVNQQKQYVATSLAEKKKAADRVTELQQRATPSR